MADTKISDLGTITAAADDDLIYIVDVSDTTDDPAGTSKAIEVSSLISKVLIQTITNATAGEFDFTSIPTGYSRLIIEGKMRGDAVALYDDVYVYLNEDTTDANYLVQNCTALNNTGQFPEYAYPRIGRTAAASSLDGYGTHRLIIEDYAGTDRKLVYSNWGYIQADNYVGVGMCAIGTSITDAITRIRLRTDNHPTDGLTGTLRLYGEH